MYNNKCNICKEREPASLTRTACDSCYTRIRRFRCKIAAILLKGGRCHDCGVKFNLKNLTIFEFHHLEEKKKDFNIKAGNGISWKRLKEEVSKCDLLCANCHKLRHIEYETDPYFIYRVFDIRKGNNRVEELADILTKYRIERTRSKTGNAPDS